MKITKRQLKRIIREVSLRLLHESRMASIERKIYNMMGGRPMSLDQASRSIGISARELRNLLSRSSLLSFSGSLIVPKSGY